MSDFYKNFLLAQSEFTTLPKDKTGYGYKYTDFDTVVTTVRPILARHGIGFFQALTENGLRTALYDNEGVQIESLAVLPDVQMAKTNNAQNLGASITYMKRYALCAILGISSDEDVDGNVQMNQRGNQHQTPQNQQSQKPKLKGGDTTENERKELESLFSATFQDKSPIFTSDEVICFKKMRYEKTAKELIALLKNEVAKRRKQQKPLEQQLAEVDAEAEQLSIF